MNDRTGRFLLVFFFIAYTGPFHQVIEVGSDA